MIELVEAGGWLMVPILACSLIATVLIIERFLALRRTRVLPPPLIAILRRWSASKEVSPADLTPFLRSSPLGRMIAVGLAHRHRSRAVLRERLEDTGRRVVHELERFLSALGTIATIAPLLGLLGTVTGMIRVFEGVAVQGNHDFSRLSTGVAEALITTAAGLSVAIFSLLFYRYFQRRIDNLVLEMEQSILELIDLLRNETNEVDSR